MIRGAWRYARWGLLRRCRVNRAMYVSVAITTTLAFLSITLDKLSSAQLSGLVAGQGAHELAKATRVLFGLGIVVSVFQTQFLAARAVGDRRREYTLLAWVSTSVGGVVATVLIEQLAHAFIGAVLGAFASLLTMSVILRLGSAPADLNVWDLLLPFGVSLVMPLLSLIPGTAYLAVRYSNLSTGEQS